MGRWLAHRGPAHSKCHHRRPYNHKLWFLSQSLRVNVHQYMKNDPSRRTVLRLVGVSGIWGAAKAGFASTLEDKCQTSSDHIAWVVESLERMLTIKPGMTRNQLMIALGKARKRGN